jgi:hypothetical protein
VKAGNNQGVFSMSFSSGARFQRIGRAAVSLGLYLTCTTFLAGCGESDTNQSNIPPDFATKLETEHPELFVKKTGRKTEVLGGRDKRDVIRREWLKAQNPDK